MNYSILDVFKIKDNIDYPILQIEADLFLLWEFAVPIDFYNNDPANKTELKTQILIRAFYPERFEYVGISVYIFTKEQFEKTFERVGTRKEFIRKAMIEAGVDMKGIE